MENGTDVTRRAMFGIAASVAASAALLPLTASAEEEPAEMITISKRSTSTMVAKDDLEIDLTKYAVYTIDLDDVDPSKVTIITAGDRFTMAEWLADSAKLGIDPAAFFASTVSITGAPTNFPGITKSQAHELAMKTIAKSGSVAYWCLLLAYGCHHY